MDELRRVWMLRRKGILEKDNLLGLTRLCAREHERGVSYCSHRIDITTTVEIQDRRTILWRVARCHEVQRRWVHVRSRPILRARGVKDDGLDREAVPSAIGLDPQARRSTAEGPEPKARGEDSSLGLEEGEG